MYRHRTQRIPIRRRRSPMTALVTFLCLVVLFFGVYAIASTIQEQNSYDINSNGSYLLSIEDQTPDQNETATDYAASQPSQYSQSNASTQEIAQPTAQIFTIEQLAEMSNDHLLLINRDFPVPYHIAGYLVRISDYLQTLNQDTLLSKDALVMLRAMFDSAASVGYTQFRVTEGFRTHEHQQMLYTSMAGTGLAAPPGHSEHQVGLAVDISYHGVNIGNSSQGTWLMDYSYRYGFILRYPEHKTEITMVPFEPWHYRFVGQPHAYFMKRNDLVLEEYIAYLRRRGEIAVDFEGVRFTVHYMFGAGETIEIPKDYLFAASRDNTGGVIVTVASQ